MKSGCRASHLTKLLSVSVLTIFCAQPAWADCSFSGTTVVCDPSAPNPYIGAIAGSNVTLNPGAQLQIVDPYAGPTVNANSVTIYGTGGQLNAQAGSKILNTFGNIGGTAIVAGAGTTINLNGNVSVQNSGVGVNLGQGATLNVGSQAYIAVSGTAANGGSVVLVTGTGTTIQVDGILVNGSSSDGTAISMISQDLFGNKVLGTGTINIGPTGEAEAADNASRAILLSSGSTLNVAGLVNTYATTSTPIDYRGTVGGTAVVNILSGGLVQSQQTPAIIGSDGVLDLTIAGTIDVRGGVTAVQLGNADDVVTLVTGASVNGVIDGGGGSNTLNLAGSGAGQVGATTNFANVAINSGSWTLTAPLSGSNGITIAPGATGIGTASLWGNRIADAGTLVFSQSADETYSGNLTGPGQLVKTGTATLTLGDQSGFTGATLVSSGQLLMTGAMPSVVTVASGGTLAGNGSVGGLALQAGSIVSPSAASGSGVGTLTVAGNYAQAAGSTYVAEVISNSADKIVVTGTAVIAPGSKLVLTLQNPALGQSYTLLSAAGGVTGEYTSVQSDLAYRLTYDGEDVVLNFGRSSAALLALARGANQTAAVGALVTLPNDNALYSALALAPDDATVRAAYPQLTGDLHGAVRASMLRSAELVAEAALARTATTQPGLSLWGQVLGSTGSSTGLDGAARVSRKSYGGIMGLEDGLGPVTLGLAGGYVHARLNAATGSATINTPEILGYARGTFAHVSVQAGLGYVWASNDVFRRVSFIGFNDTDRAHYKGHVLHGFAEIGLPVALGGGAVTPFVAGRVYRVTTNGFVEQGGAAALQAAERSRWSEMSEVGARLSTPLVGGLSAQGRLAWQHRYGASQALTELSFAAGGPAFAVQGADLSRNAAAFDLGLGWTGARRITVDLGYHGVLGERGMDNVGRLSLSVPL